MRKFHNGLKFYFAFIVFIFSTTQRIFSQDIADPELRKELLKRVDQDQAIRNDWIKKGVTKADKTIIDRMVSIDKDNTEWLKTVIQKKGWPSNKLVGKEGSQAAWLIIQHADLEFQKQMLPLVESSYKSGDLPGSDYALLLDRVLVGEGKPQIYGTQAEDFNKWEGEEPVMKPVADEANVDKRRAEVGLPPLYEYKTQLKYIYFPKEQKKP